MNWERAKTILIVLFLLINVSLILVLAKTTKNTNTISGDTINNTMQVLQNHDINVEKNAIPTKRYPNQNLNVVNVLSDTEKLAKRFLGEGVRVNMQDTSTFQFEYVKDNKKVWVHDNCFTYEVNKQVREFTDNNLDEARKSALSKLEKLLGNSEHIYVIEDRFENNLYHATVGRKYGDLKILGVYLRMTADKEDMIKLEGNWFEPNDTELVSKEKLLDVTSVLVHYVYQPNKPSLDIKTVEFGYFLPPDYVNNKEVSTIPVYAITDALGNQYVYDARSGVLLK